MKFKKDHKIPNSKSKLNDVTGARVNKKKHKSGDEYDTDSDNLDTSNYADFDDDDDEDDEENDTETNQINGSNVAQNYSTYNNVNMNVNNSKTLMI